MADESETTSRLIAQLRGGEDDALAELFTNYRDRLKRIVRFRLDYRLAGRVSESDVIQESYLSARQRADYYRGKPETGGSAPSASAGGNARCAQGNFN